MTKTRLVAADFMLLRSLSRQRWFMNEKIEWKTNRIWEYHPEDRVMASEAAYRMELSGLVEFTICCDGCNRHVVQLTPRGKAFAEKLNKQKEPIANEPTQEIQQMGWISRAMNAMKFLIMAKSAG